VPGNVVLPRTTKDENPPSGSGHEQLANSVIKNKQNTNHIANAFISGFSTLTLISSRPRCNIGNGAYGLPGGVNCSNFFLSQSHGVTKVSGLAPINIISNQWVQIALPLEITAVNQVIVSVEPDPVVCRVKGSGIVVDDGGVLDNTIVGMENDCSSKT